MKLLTLLGSCAVMALVTYAVRVLPLILVKNKIENRFVNSFLYYIPYTVLAAMVIPDIFSATAYLISAIAGFVAALITAYFGKSLFFVACTSCAVIMAFELTLRFAGVG